MYDTISNIVISGNQDTGNTEQTASLSTSWDTVSQGDGGDIAVAVGYPTATQSTRYSSASEFGSPTRRIMTSSGSLDTEETPIFNFDETMLGCDGNTTVPNPFPFNTPLVINGNSINKHRMLIGTDNGLYYSADGLDNYCRIRSGGVNNAFGGPPIAFGIESNPEIIYVAQSALIRSSNVWPPVWTTKTVGGGDIIAIAIDSSDAARAYAISDSTVYQTVNTGSNWSDITNNLDVLSNFAELTSIAFVEGTGGNGIVVSARSGVFIAKENQSFATWEELGTGLPNAPVWDLHYDPADDKLTAATMGRGSYTLDMIIDEVPVNLQSFEIQ